MQHQTIVRPRAHRPIEWDIIFGKCMTLLFYIILFSYAAITIGPFLWAFYCSFRTAADVNKMTIDFSNLTLSNYLYIAQKSPLGSWYMNSILIATIVTTANLFFNSLGGYALSRIKFPGRKIIFLFILGTMMIPSQITMIPTYIILSKLNWVNTYWGLTVPFLTGSFGVFMMRQFFMGIPIELEEAARLDGLGRFGIFTRIILPISKPALVSQMILIFMGNWNSFLWPTLLTSKKQMYTLPVGLNSLQNQYYSFQNQVMAGAMYLSIPMIILFLIFQRHFIQGIASTGSKG